MKYVGFDHLEPGKMYYIDQLNCNSPTKSIGTFINTHWSMHFNVACFKNVQNVFTKEKKTFTYTLYDYNFHRGNNFYEVQKYIIQKNMECRALKEIIGRIIPDEYFLSYLNSFIHP
jgi:hypothetical protein